VDTVHECDRQTDGRTDRITITDTVQTASHGKNCVLSNIILPMHDSHYHYNIKNTTETGVNKTKQNTDEKSPSLYSSNGCKISVTTPTTGFTTQNCRVAYKQWNHN